MSVIGLDGKALIDDKPKTLPVEPAHTYEVFDTKGASLGKYTGSIGLSGSWLAIGVNGVVIFAVRDGEWSTVKLLDADTEAA